MMRAQITHIKSFFSYIYIYIRLYQIYFGLCWWKLLLKGARSIEEKVCRERVCLKTIFFTWELKLKLWILKWLHHPHYVIFQCREKRLKKTTNYGLKKLTSLAFPQYPPCSISLTFSPYGAHASTMEVRGDRHLKILKN